MPMKRREYHSMAELEDNYWWFVGRRFIVGQQLKQLNRSNLKILNVGSGTGGLVPLLSGFGSVTNVDTSEEAIKFSRQRGIKVQKVSGVKLPFKVGSFDLIVATDVLEHIKNDKEALKEWRRVLKPGGTLLLTVPAYPWLWSTHDENLHHFRRYTISTLHRLLNQSAFKIRKRSYAIVFSFPLIVGFRFIQSLGGSKPKKATYVQLPAPINRLFIWFLQIEAQALRLINFPLGTSILVVASSGE